MTTALTFNDVTLSPVQHQGNLWIRATELARALGYASEEMVSRLYRRNADEFTDDMTQVIEIVAEGQNGLLANGRSRIFSPRGCHMIAMLARTKVAKAFRRWVLDVLDKFATKEEKPAALTVSTTASRKPVEKLLKVWASQAGLPHAQCWTMLNAAFNLGSIAEMPEQWLPDAAAWIQAKIDSLPKSLPQAGQALPQLPNAVLDAGTYECGKPFFDDVNRLRRNAEAVREALHVFARPGGRSMILSDEKQMLYDNANEAANMAVSALNQAIYALRMIYNIRAHVSFSR